jgi:hypothetical protein
MLISQRNSLEGENKISQSEDKGSEDEEERHSLILCHI